MNSIQHQHQHQHQASHVHSSTESARNVQQEIAKSIREAALRAAQEDPAINDLGKLRTEHIECLRVVAQGASQVETMGRAANLVDFLHRDKDLQRPKPSDLIRYCWNIYIYAYDQW